jgi:hypothetical protein
VTPTHIMAVLLSRASRYVAWGTKHRVNDRSRRYHETTAREIMTGAAECARTDEPESRE